MANRTQSLRGQSQTVRTSLQGNGSADVYQHLSSEELEWNSKQVVEDPPQMPSRIGWTNFGKKLQHAVNITL